MLCYMLNNYSRVTALCLCVLLVHFCVHFSIQINQEWAEKFSTNSCNKQITKTDKRQTVGLLNGMAIESELLYIYFYKFIKEIKSWYARGEFVLSDEVKLLFIVALLCDFATVETADHRPVLAAIVNTLTNRNTYTWHVLLFIKCSGHWWWAWWPLNCVFL